MKGVRKSIRGDLTSKAGNGGPRYCGEAVDPDRPKVSNDRGICLARGTAEEHGPPIGAIEIPPVILNMTAGWKKSKVDICSPDKKGKAAHTLENTASPLSLSRNVFICAIRHSWDTDSDIRARGILMIGRKGNRVAICPVPANAPEISSQSIDEWKHDLHK